MSTELSLLLQQSSPRTFFDLLTRYRIAIPCLQRHYVQGESTPKAKDVLCRFLRDLLDNCATETPVQLHFMFGPLDTHGADTFQPIDGQQRLTTIWLLSRYAVAWLDDAQERVSFLQLLSRFTYRERIHSERFLQRLTEADRRDEDWRETPSISMLKCGILNGGWKEDRTVSSMVNTLDTIASLWKEYKPKPDATKLLTWIWKKLVFHVHMEHFSDDLYMKMNARGLPLTQWEKMKGFFAESFDTECNYSERIEKVSNDFFKVFEASSDCLPDDAFLSFLGRIAHYLQVGSQSVIENQENTEAFELNALAECNWENDRVILPFTSFDQFKSHDSFIFPKETQLALLNMMEYLVGEVKDICLPEWDGMKKSILAQAVFHPENAHQRDLSIVLFEYFLNFQKPDTPGSLEHSLRLIWNVLGDGNVTRDKDNPYKRVAILRDCFIRNSSSPFLYKNTNRPHFQENDPWQYREELLKMEIYQNPSEWSEPALNGLHKAEALMHGRVNIVLTNPSDSHLCQSRIVALNRLGNAWKNAFSDNNYGRMQLLLSSILMAMPYWPSDDWFRLEKKEGTLRALLNKNGKFLAKSLLDYLDHKPEAGPDDILANNQYGFNSHEHKIQPWRRDWQKNLLLWEKMNEKSEYIFGKKVQHHGSSDCFYLYQTEYIRGAIPLNDYRFDFICNDTLKKALIDFYQSFGTNPVEMTMNDSSTRSTELKLHDGCRRVLYFYQDHVAISYYNEENGNGSWSSQQTVVFKDNNGKSIFSQEELASRATEFFNTITDALNNHKNK